MTPDAEENLLRSLAIKLTEHPRATLQELATGAGVSRATLYRYAPTREQVLDKLKQHMLKVMQRIMDSAGLETRPPLDALRQLIANHISEREFCAFMITQFEPHIKKSTTNPIPDECEIHEARLDRFFLAGQAAGVFRVNVPHRWLTDLFFSFVFGLCESEYRGRIARAEMQTVFEEMFLKGAVAQPEQATQ